MSAAPHGFQDPRHAGLILGLTTGSLTVLAALVLTLPGPSYLPEVGRWTLHAPPGVIAMSYYGLPFWGAGGIAFGWGLARVAPIGAALSRRAAASLLAAGAAGAVMLSLAYCLVAELTRWSAR